MCCTKSEIKTVLYLDVKQQQHNQKNNFTQIKIKLKFINVH